MDGWKSTINEAFNRKTTDQWSIVQQAVFDYQTVYVVTILISTEGTTRVPFAINEGRLAAPRLLRGAQRRIHGFLRFALKGTWFKAQKKEDHAGILWRYAGI